MKKGIVFAITIVLLMLGICTVYFSENTQQSINIEDINKTFGTPANPAGQGSSVAKSNVFPIDGMSKNGKTMLLNAWIEENGSLIMLWKTQANGFKQFTGAVINGKTYDVRDGWNSYRIYGKDGTTIVEDYNETGYYYFTVEIQDRNSIGTSFSMELLTSTPGHSIAEAIINFDIDSLMVKHNYGDYEELDWDQSIDLIEEGQEIQLSAINDNSNFKFTHAIIEYEDGTKETKTTENFTMIAKKGKNQVIFYYDPMYIVEYYYDGVIDDTKTEKLPAKVGEVIDTYPDKVILGYKEINTENFPLTITTTPENNIIKVYYEKDDFDYTVEYYYDGKIDDTKTENLKATFKDVINTYPDKVIDGYVFSHTENIPLEITEDSSRNVMKIFYDRRTDLSYTVNYLELGTNEVIKTPKIVKNQTFGTTIASSSEWIMIDGYEFDSFDQNVIIIGTGTNVINAYYTKQTNLSYTVNYYEEGTTNKLATSKVVNNQTYKDTITENAIDIDGYNKHEPTIQTITIDIDGNVINFYYTKRTDLNYRVEYYYDEILDSTKTGKFIGTFKDVITLYEDKTIPGYVYEKDTAPLTIGTDETQNVIKVYYIKRTDLEYTVEYYYDGILDNTKTEKYINQRFEDVIDTYVDKVITGYKLSHTENMPLTVSYDNTQNIIKVYYVRQSDISYTVNYYEEGTTNKLATSKTVNGQIFGSNVTENAIDIEGYDKVDPTSQTITINVTGNEINFYYTKRTDLEYVVNYYENKTLVKLATSKLVTSQIFKDTVTENAIDIAGYNKVGEIEKTITIEVKDNEINFYYEKRTDLSYTVNYYEEGTTNKVATSKVVDEQIFKDTVTENAIDIDGYNKVNPTSKSIIIEVDGNEINFYYEKRTDLSYTVNYLEFGTNEVIRTQKIVNNQTFGTTIASSSEWIMIDGYDFNSFDKNVITIGTGSNVINAYYTKRTDLSYTVNYILQNPDPMESNILADPKVVNNQTFKDMVTESAIDIDGYNKVEPTTQSITIEVDGNEINFYYTKRTDLSYTIKYLELGTNIKLAEDFVENGCTFGFSRPVWAKSIDGYNSTEYEKYITITTGYNEVIFYYTKRTDLSYSVEYYYDGIIDNTKTMVYNNQTFEDLIYTYEDKVIPGYELEQDNVPILIGTKISENVIRVYYIKRTDLEYTVEYYYDGKIDDTKTEKYTNQTFEDVINTYQDKVITGYKFSHTENLPLTISYDNLINVVKVYYVRQSDISYTVNYYEEGTENKLATSKTVNNQVFGDTVTESAIDIEGYNKVNPTDVTITIDVTENEINFYYTKRTDLEYTVNYYEKGTTNKLAISKVLNNQTFGDTVTETAIDINGYNKVNPTDMTITIKVTGNEINFYYEKRTDLEYRVEYYYDNVIDNSKTETYLNQTFEDTITTYIDKTVPGYRLESDTAPIVIGTDENLNVIKVYYVKRTDLEYIVEYYYDGKIDDTKTEKHIDQTFKNIINTYQDKVIEGYELANTENYPLTISEKNEANVMKIFYTRRTDLEYTVNYYEAGTTNKLATSKNIKNQTFGTNITENAIDIDGYYKQEPSSVTITINVTGNEINFYYEKRTDLSYKVEYYYDGIIDDTKTMVYNNQTFEAYIDTYEDKVIPGYRLEVDTAPIILGTTISENVIRVYYIKRTDLSYKVEYYYDGVIDNSKTEIYSNQTFGTVINNYNDKTITGYELSSTENYPLTISADDSENIMKILYIRRTDLSYTVNYYEEGTTNKLATSKVINGQKYNENVTESAIDINGYNKVDPTDVTITIDVTGNEINFYYTKRTDLNYRVEYYYDNVIDDTKTGKFIGTFKDVITNYEDKTIPGYEYEKDTAPITLGTDETQNVIKVYYIKRTDLSYLVEYYYDGVLDDTKTEKYNNQRFEDVIDTYIDKNMTGYKLSHTENMPLTISYDNAENVVKVYYVRQSDISYTVNYYEEGTENKLATSKTVNNQTFGEEVTENAIDIEGYDKVNPTSQTITIDIDNNIINFYYTKRVDLEYTVNYYENGTLEKLLTSKIVTDQTFKDTVTETAPDIDGYNKVGEVEKTITIEVKDNEINFYYEKRKDLSYTVNYYEEGTTIKLADSKVVNNKTLKDTVTESAIDIAGYNKVNPTDKTIIIEATGNEINFYYTKRIDLSYTVNYYEEGTTDELATSKVVNNKTFKEVVTENAIDIVGYNKLDPVTQTITIDVTGNVINFYYTKRKDLEYTVNYYEEGTTIKLADSKVVDNKTLKDTVTESAIDIEGYNKVNPVTQTITIEVTGNVINFYYTKRTDLSYTVNYYEEGTNNKLADSKVVNNKTFKELVTENAIDIDGYDKQEPTSKSITIDVTGNVINFYYTKRTNLSYSVEYYYDGIIDNNKTMIYNNQTFETYIDTYEDKVIPGYRLEVDTAPIIIGTDIAENVIRVYYVKRTDLTYTVEYYYSGIIDDTKTEIYNNQTFGTVIDTYVDKNIIGHKLSHTENNPLTVTADVAQNIMKVYYVKQSDISYTVNYYEEGTNAKLANSKVLNNQTFGDTVTENAIDIVGYNKVEPSTQTIIIDVDNNIIDFYYTKRTDLSYTVNYYEKGTTNKLVESKVVTDQTFKQTVTENAIDIEGFNKVTTDSQTITIEVAGNEINFYYERRTDLSYTVNYYEKGTLEQLADIKTVNNQTFGSIVTENAITIDGYNKVEPSSVAITINVTGNEITFYYEKKTDLNYTVEYYYDGILDDSKTETYEATYKDIINSYVDKNITGYTLSKTENLPLTISAVTSNNVIRVYYEKRNDLTYTVEYYYDNVIKSDETETVIATYGDIITTYIDKNIAGYKFSHTENLPLAVTEVSSNNVIKVYYEKDNFGYTVEYYYDGIKDDSKTELNIATFGDVITTYIDKVIEGYELNRATVPLTITEKVENNVIRVYYEKRGDLTYTVEYYYDGIIDNAKTVIYRNQKFGDIITTYLNKETYGYEFERVENLPLQIGTDNGANLIRVYYQRKDAEVIVRYVDKLSGLEISDRVIRNCKMFDNYDITQDEKIIEDYTLIEKPNPLVGIVSNEVETFTYYYAANTKVVVRFVEEETLEELSEPLEIIGYEGMPYKTDIKVIDNYTYTQDSGNTEGIMTKNPIEVIYYYAQNTQATERHIDELTGEVLYERTEQGKVGDLFVTEPKDFEGYVLTKAPIETTVKMEKTEIILEYYYKRISSGVIEKHIDIKTDKVLYSVVYEGNEGDPYKTTNREFKGYDLVEDKLPENAEGTMTVELIEVKYYYIRQTNVVVNYIDKITGEYLTEKNTETGEEIDSTVTFEGHEGDSYKSEEKNFEDYILIEKPENAEGTMKVLVDDNGKETTTTVVNYYYVHKSAGVKENHIDIITGEVLDSKLYEGNEGDSYKTESKTIEKYELVEDRLPMNSEGTMSIELIEVNYYYIKKSKVIVKYVDEITNKEIVDDVIIEGKETDRYITETKELDKYVLQENKLPENAQGEMKGFETIVTYYYRHESAGVIEKHIDEKTGELLHEEIKYTGNEGDSYKTEAKAFDGYDLIKTPDNKEGTMKIETIEVNYYYVRKARVTVEYRESGTENILADTTEIAGHEGDSYKTERKVIAGYVVSKLPENREGTMTVTRNSDGSVNNEIKVVYYYEKEAVKVPDIKPQEPVKPLPEPTPGTGDILPIAATGTIFLVIILNVLQIIISKKRKDKNE